MRAIYTYFDASLDLPDQGEVIFHWHSSWRKHGWEPRMLTPLTWRSHPDRKALKKALRALDPISRARIMRILALWTLNRPVLLCDYDVINYGLEADSGWTEYSGDYIYASKSFGWFGAQGVKTYIEDVLGADPEDDLFWIADYVAPCLDYGADGWQTSDLLHFSTSACAGKPKHRVIETCGRNY